MKKITKSELDVFLRKHKLWLIDDPEGERANLWGANLRGADLSSADLRGANLWGANLWGADLRGANLSSADLRGANLSSANLSSANLWGANLWGADLRGANLSSADLSSANLRGADLRGAKNLVCPIACPEKGSFTAFKKAGKYVVELFVPTDALRCSATSRKCRCSKAKVISITNLDGSDAGIDKVNSGYDSNFIYTVGQYVEVPDFEKDRWKECSAGIHFFITRQEAVDY